jgi:glycosyltransferase involved in cell wall biosynthesis
VQNWGWKSLAYCFPGIENPLEQSRYAWARPFSRTFDCLLFRALQKCDLILASSDKRAIRRLVNRSNGAIPIGKVVEWATRVDTEVFYPDDKNQIRLSLGLGLDECVIAFCGRLNRVKGWDLALDAFHSYLERYKSATLCILGEGEDRGVVGRRIVDLGISSRVRLLGSVSSAIVAKYYNAADVVISTSIYEGWSTSVLEALACGKPVISTDVSGARDVIRDGANGYVVSSRDPAGVADAIASALKLPDVASNSLRIAERYSLGSLRAELQVLWPAIRDDVPLPSRAMNLVAHQNEKM